MSVRFIITIVVIFIITMLLSVRVFMITADTEVIEASSGIGRYKVNSIGEYACIYDCKGNRLNSCAYEYRAVLNPNDDSVIIALPYITDMEVYNSGIQGNLPFLCRVTKDNIDNLIIFKSAVRTDENQLARHIIGYTSDNVGVCGLEYSYDDFFRSIYSKNSAEYNVNAVGGVLDGLDYIVSYAKPLDDGVTVTIDKNIQQICENAMENAGIEKGAVIVMDVKSGEIRACASYPEFDLNNLEASIDSGDAPFINRAFSAYSVGSIFKLVTSAAALELGISSDFSYVCEGSIDVNGQIFNCHKWGGHGEISLYEAIENSCNPYFIALSEYIDRDAFLQTAKNLGFGTETVFADGITSVSGYFPNEQELAVAAELGNFSFGQGKLTATPLQICRMTAAIANNGMCPSPKLVLGKKNSDGLYDKVDYPINKRAISYLTAQKLQTAMIDAVNADNSHSKSYIVESAGKTSTAQTGRFDINGTEYVNCWFTGYFPLDNPKYAVTILVENGVSGNVSAAPVYKRIAERITLAEKNTKDT